MDENFISVGRQSNFELNSAHSLLSINTQMGTGTTPSTGNRGGHVTREAVRCTSAQICAEVLSVPELAYHFWSGGSGLRLLLDDVTARFPADAEPVLELCAALAQAGQHSLDQVNPEAVLLQRGGV